MMQKAAIPRRLSVHDDAIDYSFTSRLRICLDGVEQKAVTAYDIDAGAVTRYVLDEKGKPVINAVRDEVETETVEGEVKVTLMPAKPNNEAEGA
jgi:hypothetical protein